MSEWEWQLEELRRMCSCDDCWLDKAAVAVKILRELAGWGDKEIAHSRADDVLLVLIGDESVTAAFEAIDKWYA